MKRSMKALAPVAAVALAGGAFTVIHLAGDDGGDSARRAAAPANAPAPAEQVAEASVGDPNDPSTWRLPIEAYVATSQESRLVAVARDELIDQCMEKAGYAQWQPAPELPEIGGKTLTDWRYGIHDAELASTRGYHPAVDEQEAYDQAMEEGAVDESGAPAEAVKSCASEADQGVPSAQPAAAVQEVSSDAFVDSQTSPLVIDVFAAWSNCMKDKGYAYKKPMDASDDPRFSDPAQVTPLEIATAKADIACRDKHSVAKTWFDAESKSQREKIAKRLPEFNEAAEAVRAAVAKAKAA
ncbi:hypothetical protein HUT18_14390 [Streptomyces sp. NA04227]|uniref:hypothetical protein n=1 Tax=Streptomyces sp. NA04227 TaxID=2742136 RepID=UPI001590939A|nr:hypothetical protein [Streptomyces sp. NA04227]QKW07397.1 hypothetical protein HUT18_14390 [Streptomyces sp. NA04227]